MRYAVSMGIRTVCFFAAVVVGLFFAVLYFGSGWFSRMFAKRLAATGKI